MAATPSYYRRHARFSISAAPAFFHATKPSSLRLFYLQPITFRVISPHI